jgi:hypothetical protein
MLLDEERKGLSCRMTPIYILQIKKLSLIARAVHIVEGGPDLPLSQRSITSQHVNVKALRQNTHHRLSSSFTSAFSYWLIFPASKQIL